MKRYSAYKPSGVEWIGDIPEKWEIKRGKFVLALLAGFPADSDLFTDDESCMPLIRIRDINNASTEIFYKGKYPNLYIVNTNDVLIGMDGDFNIAKWQGRKALLNQRVCRIIDSPKLDTNFAYYLLSQPLRLINDVTYATTVKHLSTNDLMNCLLPIPPLSEQVAIAAYLDSKCAKIDNVLSVQQKRIDLLKELKQSIITNAVTKGLDKNVEFKPSGIEWIGNIPENWTLMKLKHICKDEKYSIKTGPFGSQLKGEDLREEGDVRVYNQRNVIDDCFDDVQFFVTSAKAKDLQSFFTKENDLLVTSRGTIGKCSILPKTAPMGVLHPCLIALRINEKKCSLRWAKFFINESDCFKTNVFLNSNATTIEVIYTDTLKGIFIPLPPIKEQLEIISYLERKCSAIDNQISKIERQIELLKEYKQSIITECVTGKRKVC